MTYRKAPNHDVVDSTAEIALSEAIHAGVHVYMMNKMQGLKRGAVTHFGVLEQFCHVDNIEVLLTVAILLILIWGSDLHKVS